MIGIYKITSPTNKVYIGQSRNVRKRINAYKNVKEIGKQKKIFASLLKHGADAHIFEIAHELPEDIDQDTLDRYEQFYMDHYINLGFKMLNICPTANSQSGHKWSDESKKNQSERMKGKPSGRKGAKLTDEQKAILLACRKGSKASEETKRKMSLSQMGKKRGPMPRHIVERLAALKRGKKLSPEHIEKLKQSASLHFKGKSHTESTRQKMRDAWVKKKDRGWKQKPIKYSDEVKRARSIAMKGKPSYKKGKKYPKVKNVEKLDNGLH